MVQLITFLLVVAALVILVLQNLNPVLSLVVLGQSTLALPLAVWLLCAIAIGALCSLIIYQLVPSKRPYRPMGKRLSDPPPAPPPNRFVNAPMDGPNDPVANRSPEPTQNPYDRDWDEFRAPEQWEDWGQQTAASAPRDNQPRPSTDDAMRDIESGWGDDDYENSGRFASRQNAGPEDRNDGQNYAADNPERPSTRTYDEGWLYGSDDVEPGAGAQSEEPGQGESDEDVYDANYRVIIPPFDTKNE